MADQKCSRPIGMWGHYCCGKTAKYQTDGKWFCGTHDPTKKQARREKRHAAWKVDFDKEQTVREQLRQRSNDLTRKLGVGKWGGEETITLTFAEAESLIK